MAELQRGVKQSAATIEKRVAQFRGKKRPAWVVEKIRAAHAARTPEAKAATSARMSEQMKGRLLSDEQKAHLRAINLGKKQSPETIAKRVAAIKETWARKRAASAE